MRKMLAMFLLLALATLQPSLAQPTRFTVDSPRNGTTLDGPILLTGNATPGSLIEVRGELSGTTRADRYGHWQIALDPFGRVASDTVDLIVQASGPWGITNPTYLRYALFDDSRTTAYNYYNRYNKTLADSMTDPYYDYADPSNTYPNNVRGEVLRLSVNSPTNGTTMQGNFALTGTGTPGVQVVVTGSLSGTATVNSNGYWSMPMSMYGLARGTVLHLTAFARDQVGNHSPATQLKYAVGP